MNLYNILFLTEATQISKDDFEKVMRLVYDNLPDHVFWDMFHQEHQHENINDPDIGERVKELTVDVLEDKPNAVETFRDFERQRESEWINTKWSSKQSNPIKLAWNDLSSVKQQFFMKKYLGLNPHFPARTPEGKGYLDKIERMLKNPAVLDEPVILLQKKGQDGFDIIGGNNRIFNQFLKLAKDKISSQIEYNQDFFQQVFDYLNNNNPSITINALTGYYSDGN